MTVVTARPVETAPPRVSPVLRAIGAVLCLAVVYLHVKDQNGFPGAKGQDSAQWVQVGYYLIEGIGVLSAVLLLTKAARTGWFLAIGVAAGPLVGYILSRSTGLPSYGGDIGNWFGDAGKPFTQWVDVTSAVCETILLLLAASAFTRIRRERRP